MPSDYPLPSSDLASLGFAARPLDHLDALIQQHIEEGRYPGAQIALARHGKLALFRTYGDAKTEPAQAAGDQRHAVPAVLADQGADQSAVWTLVEEGKLSFMDKVADHLPEFAARGKADITLHQVMTHQGGFPNNNVTKATWTDHARMRAEVCDFSLDWTPGSKLQYHGQAAHLVQAMVIEAVTGQDYRDVIRDKRDRAARAWQRHLRRRADSSSRSAAPTPMRRKPRDNSAEFRAAGLPSGGGFATARGMAAFYQMLGHGGRLGDVRLFSPRLIAYVSRNHTGERGDEQMNGIPMHRGLGPACAWRERPHPRPRHDRRTGDVRSWRRGLVLFLGRSEQRRVVHLSDEFRVARSVAFGAAGSGGEPGARGDRLSEHSPPPGEGGGMTKGRRH